MNILETIQRAGIVGCGGAGFPTHAKLKPGMEYLIINGAECEPLLRTDRYIMKNRAKDVVRAISAVQKELGFAHAVIALKHHYRQETAALQSAIEEAGADIAIHGLESYYPAGDEQMIVYEVTGRVVPPGGIPAAVGAVVDNVATMLAIAEAMDAKPFIKKILTVTGEVRQPAILCVPVGTSYKTCIELAGGALHERFVLVSGGPMMGKTLTAEQMESAVVTKTTSGILVLPEDGYHARTQAVDLRAMLARARSACIQCSFCSQLCPRHMLGHPLEPHRIMRAMATGADVRTLLSDPVVQNAQLCCECGICEVYACPMGLFPRQINALIKREMAAAKMRVQAPQKEWKANPMRESRKAPSQKVAARAGVRAYDGWQIGQIQYASPRRVELPLKMHIGAPCVPCIEDGCLVREGEMIARPPEGALGAVIHASLTGRAAVLPDRIVIEREADGAPEDGRNEK